MEEKNAIRPVSKRGYLLVNFGGPRSLDEVGSFLNELLADRDIIRSGLPGPLHRALFGMIAYFRQARLQGQYKQIGGSSPIYSDSEWIAQKLRERLAHPLWTFHRYLKATHLEFEREFEAMLALDEIIVIPLFPQFSYATTGSIARWMQEHLPLELWRKLRWISSYADHPQFIKSYASRLTTFLEEKGWKEEEVALLCSFHGLPQAFVQGGDPYQHECERSFNALKSYFPKAQFHLSNQSKFGPGEWLRPYTSDEVEKPGGWLGDRSKVVVVPLAFTSDHIETLSEIEKDYLPPLRRFRVNGKQVEATRLPALGRDEAWSQALGDIVEEFIERPYGLIANQLLVPSYCSCPLLCPKLGRCACPKRFT